MKGFKGKFKAILSHLFEFEDYGIFFNALLVQEKYGQVMTIPPNVRYQDLFLKLQREAREKSKGLWGRRMFKIRGGILISLILQIFEGKTSHEKVILH
jgi:endonuclease YncB( thermonuclease family)